MTDTTLKERLDAAVSIIDAATHSELINYHECIFRSELDLAFRSGDLVTKEELEAAVAKAVAEEREACAGIADQVDIESSQLAAEGPITKTAIRAFRATAFGIAKQIRARGEGG